MHIQNKRPRDFGEVAAVELIAMKLAAQLDDECWELRTAQERHSYRELAEEMMVEAMQFWGAKN